MRAFCKKKPATEAARLLRQKSQLAAINPQIADYWAK